MKQVKLNTGATRHEEQARKLADILRKALPKHLGFTLFVFDQGKESTEVDPTHVTYISTAKRPDMVETIRAWVKKAAP